MNCMNASYVQGAKYLGQFFENPSRKKKAQLQRVGKQVVKPLDPSGRNNGSQAHEINK